MTINVTRRAAVVGLSTCIALPVRAQTPTRPKDAEGFATLEQPATFEIAANTGSLKETVQKGQQLVWRPKGGASDGGFRVNNISVAFLRRGKIERQRSCQRRRVASLLGFRYFRQVRRQGPAAHPTHARRPNRRRRQCLYQRQQRRSRGTGRAEFSRGESSAV